VGKQFSLIIEDN